MRPDPAVTELLRCAARIELDERERTRLSAVADKVQCWDDVAAAAEAHGLAPLLYTHLRAASVEIPRESARQLLALTVRHRHAALVRNRVLREILDAFEASGIPAIVLKGAALAHVLYPSPELRPMNDLDLLVDADLAERAQAVLGNRGFFAPLVAENVRLIGHHHLAPAIRVTDGVVVQVEIHHNALSRDWNASLTIRTLIDAPRLFPLDGGHARTLGHRDMLRHLSRHCADRGPLFRLGWVADLVGYAHRYRDEIDWKGLTTEDPFAINALSLMHFVTPLPEALARELQPPTAPVPGGAGESGKSLEMILQRGRSLSDVSRDVLYPSDWWLRLYYGVALTSSLAWCRWIRHPAHVLRGAIQRAAIYMRWRVGLTP